MDTEFATSPMLPAWALFPSAAIIVALLAYNFTRLRGKAAKFVFFACALRYLLAAFHNYTYASSPAGLSWIALASIGIVGLGFLLLDKRRFVSWFLLPVVLIVGLMLVSALLNRDVADAIEPIVRFGYFVVLCVGFAEAIERGGQTFLTRFLWVFLPPLVFQVLSVLLGVAKAGELDGSTSYIGGYFHEAGFSLILATCLVAACFATKVKPAVKSALLLVSLAGIWLANYRTTILGVAPIALLQFVTGIPMGFRRSQRPFVLGSIVLCGALVLVMVASLAGDRFSDFGVALHEGTHLIKPPETFSANDRHLLSARPYIWSNYIYAYYKGGVLQHLIGFGPDSWVGNFTVYAHNTLISYLYELGIIGVGAILLLWGTMFAIALTVPKGLRKKVIAAHVSFFILNMATMPHWQIEGNILYGLICGYTIAVARAERAARGKRRARARSRLSLHGLYPAAARRLPFNAPSITSQ